MRRFIYVSKLRGYFRYSGELDWRQTTKLAAPVMAVLQVPYRSVLADEVLQPVCLLSNVVANVGREVDHHFHLCVGFMVCALAFVAAIGSYELKAERACQSRNVLSVDFGLYRNCFAGHGGGGQVQFRAIALVQGYENGPN